MRAQQRELERTNQLLEEETRNSRQLQLQKLGGTGNKTTKAGKKKIIRKKANVNDDEDSDKPRSPNLHDDNTVSSEDIEDSSTVLEEVAQNKTTKRTQKGDTNERKGKKQKTTKKVAPTIDTVEEIVAVLDHRVLKKNKPQFQVEWDNGFVMWGEPKDLIDDGAGNLIRAYVKQKLLHIVNPWKGIWKKCGGK